MGRDVVIIGWDASATWSAIIFYFWRRSESGCVIFSQSRGRISSQQKFSVVDLWIRVRVNLWRHIRHHLPRCPRQQRTCDVTSDTIYPDARANREPVMSHPTSSTRCPRQQRTCDVTAGTIYPDARANREPVTSQPASSVPMPAPTEKTNVRETRPVPSYGVEQ